MTGARDERRYVRSVESGWSSLSGQRSVMSPREYEAVDGWRRRGIPLSVVLEVMAVAARKRGGRLPRSVTAMAGAVEAAWEAVAGGRATGGAVGAAPSYPEALAAWAARRDGEAAGSPLRLLLARLLDDAARGTEPAALDASLDRELPDSAAEALRTLVLGETAAELAAFRGRFTDDSFRAMRARAVVDRLRTKLALPRLTLAR